MKRWHNMSLKAIVRLTLGLVLLTGLLALTGSFTSNAHAATVITVSTCDETSLDTALNSAVNGNTIDFSCNGTISLTNTLVISQSITLDGNGQQVSIDGGGTTQILQVGSGVNFTLNDLTISNGYSSSSGISGTGGGLYNNGGSVTITNSTFTGNKADIAGGAIDNTGGGSLLISNSIFTNSTAVNGGGGAVVNTNGRIVISNSTFTNNAANNDAGGGLFNDSGSVTITDAGGSTVTTTVKFTV